MPEEFTPPAINTLPSGSSVAACNLRAVPIEPVRLKVWALAATGWKRKLPEEKRREEKRREEKRTNTSLHRKSLPYAVLYHDAPPNARMGEGLLGWSQA